jgi:hypothetical protein
MATTPGGELLLAIDNGSLGAHLVRWDGTSFASFGSGIDAPAYALAVTAAGELAVGGDFTTASGVIAARLARLASSCPAALTVTGAGCPGAAGQATLTSPTRAWAGGLCLMQADGVAANALACAVLGLAPQALPLQTLHPAAAPGCTLHVQDDAALLALPCGGRASFAWQVPPDPGLLGLPLHGQVVVAELSPVGAVQALSVSNALRLDIGIF